MSSADDEMIIKETMCVMLLTILSGPAFEKVNFTHPEDCILDDEKKKKQKTLIIKRLIGLLRVRIIPIMH